MLSTTGSIAELMPFTAQIIRETKENVEGAYSRQQSQIENISNTVGSIMDILAVVKDQHVVSGLGSVTILEAVESRLGRQDWSHKDILTNHSFTW